MTTKYGLLSILNVSELCEIADYYGIPEAKEYYKDQMVEMMADVLTKKEVLEEVSSYRLNYLDYWVDENRRNSFVYVLKDRQETVYYGITYDLETRIREHERSGKVFTNWSKLHGPMYRENAELKEWDLIEHFQDTHGGKPPRYNKKKVY